MNKLGIQRSCCLELNCQLMVYQAVGGSLTATICLCNVSSQTPPGLGSPYRAYANAGLDLTVHTLHLGLLGSI